MSAAVSANLSEQIQHHLSSFDVRVVWGFFSFSFHLDVVLMTIFLLGSLSAFFYIISRKLTLHPSSLQNFIESIVEVPYSETIAVSPNYTHLIGPLGLTVFIAVLLMNMMDFLPSSLGGEIMHFLGFSENFKAVPTADLNVTLALATLTLIVIQTTVIKKHGLGHYLYGWIAHPLGLAAFPANIILRVVEEFSRVFSLAMRLYGNMFAGELIFAVLAIAPAYIRAPGVFAWCLFHILIVYLQAFIFMMLTVIGFGLALDH